MNKQEAYKIVLDDLKKVPLFTGIYDAKNGGRAFMYGVNVVMRRIAYTAGDTNFDSNFFNNIIESETKAEVDK